MSKHSPTDEQKADYCKCRISSPSSHHEFCINKDCNKYIRTTGELLGEAQRDAKFLLRCIDWDMLDEDDMDRVKQLAVKYGIMDKDGDWL